MLNFFYFCIFLGVVMVSLETVVKRNSGFINTEIDEDLVIMDDKIGSFYGLNETGRLIWNLLDTPKSLQEVTTALTEGYDVSFDQCYTDIAPFITTLIEKGVLETVA